MARAEDIRALEAMQPWLRSDFRAGLAALSESTAETARRFAADMRQLHALTAMVPRCSFDERGATPWTSFRREIAVARSSSDQAAARDIRIAQRLIGCLPRTLGLLEAGGLTEQRARAFVSEVEVYDDDLAAELDELLAERIAALPVRRIVEAVRKAALELDPGTAAARVAAKNADRGVELTPSADDQALASVFGPAVPLTRWYGTLDQQVRALKQAGDSRTLDQLRFDLATSTFPCTSHAPADPIATGTDSARSTDADGSAASGTPPPAADPADAAPDPADLTDATWRLSDTDLTDTDLTDTDLTDTDLAAAGLRLGAVEPASNDCRRGRPVQAMITVPVETALGLSNEPGWLDGYGWLSAPTTRTLLIDAELRQLCTQTATGQLVDLADHDVRPPPPPTDSATRSST